MIESGKEITTSIILINLIVIITLRGNMSNDNSNKPEVFVDNNRYDWDHDTINGAQLRELASLPDNVQIFHEIPGQPDEEIKNDTTVDLTEQARPDRFSSQSVGSGAGTR